MNTAWERAPLREQEHSFRPCCVLWPQNGVQQETEWSTSSYHFGVSRGYRRLLAGRMLQERSDGSRCVR